MLQSEVATAIYKHNNLKPYINVLVRINMRHYVLCI